MNPLASNSCAPCVKGLALIPDEADRALHRRNCDVEAATRRLRELVPLLEFVNCIVEEITPKRTVLSLDLSPSAMNQNGTHQASVFYLIADYTLGIGMFGVLPGCYVTGVHDRCNALPVQYWLKSGCVQHLAPGTGRLRAVAQISPEDAQALRRQLAEKGRGELSGIVHIYQGSHLVAEARHTMGIYADTTRTAGVRANLFQVQNMKTSALMICGLREDPLSQRIAQEQGRAIANRMAVATPQLPGLVRARTVDIERYLQHHGDDFAQVLVLGVGFDPKPARFASAGQTWFGLDLREMIREREARFSQAGVSTPHFIPVVGDILSEDWDEAVRRAGFRSDLPTFVIAEGLSMYFPRDVLSPWFRKLRGLTGARGSRFWLDHVASTLFDLDHEEVRAFLSTMARLGEPFITGFDDPSTVAPDAWTLSGTTSAAAILGVSDEIHRQYRFSVLKPARKE